MRHSIIKGYSGPKTGNSPPYYVQRRLVLVLTLYRMDRESLRISTFFSTPDNNSILNQSQTSLDFRLDTSSLALHTMYNIVRTEYISTQHNDYSPDHLHSNSCPSDFILSRPLLECAGTWAWGEIKGLFIANVNRGRLATFLLQTTRSSTIFREQSGGLSYARLGICQCSRRTGQKENACFGLDWNTPVRSFWAGINVDDYFFLVQVSQDTYCFTTVSRSFTYIV